MCALIFPPGIDMNISKINAIFCSALFVSFIFQRIIQIYIKLSSGSWNVRDFSIQSLSLSSLQILEFSRCLQTHTMNSIHPTFSLNDLTIADEMRFFFLIVSVFPPFSALNLGVRYWCRSWLFPDINSPILHQKAIRNKCACAFTCVRSIWKRWIVLCTQFKWKFSVSFKENENTTEKPCVFIQFQFFFCYCCCCNLYTVCSCIVKMKTKSVDLNE